jgi:CDP-glucose 4,6-dehydratase
MFNNIYSGKKVLITGHTGFKGSWLSIWLKHLGAEVAGVSLDPPSDPSNFKVCFVDSFVKHHRVDIRNAEALAKVVHQIQPDFIFHLAAQALVRPSYENPLDTLTTNAIGSANLLDALRTLKKSVVAVMITSDKAYDNVEWTWGYRETDRLGGKDPYSASKGMAELAIRTYVESYFNQEDSNIRVGIARAGNVIGGGDWAKDRIVPDCMYAWFKKQSVEIRSPEATRPWQHVLEPLSGYLLLGKTLQQSNENQGEAYNFGPPATQNHSVRGLIDAMAEHWTNVRWNDISNFEEHPHEAGLLKLNCDKALFGLQWTPTLQFEETVELTVKWYKQYYKSLTQKNRVSMHEFTISQIEDYINLASERGIEWTK